MPLSAPFTSKAGHITSAGWPSPPPAAIPAPIQAPIPSARRRDGGAEKRRALMKPRVTLITIGVDDLERALRFYRDGLGLKTDGIVGAEFAYGAVAFFDLQAGLKLALWPRQSIARDAGLPLSAASATEF